MAKVCLMCGGTFPDATTFCPKDGSALRAAVQGDHLIGEVFCDRYVVTDLLGEGGMGAVYAARDVRLPQQVAIKVLREQGMADASVVARFRQEAEAASRINHDRIARVTDFGFMTDGRAFLVMEYVGGRTLKQVVADRGTLDVGDVSVIITMVAEGLDAAHRLGIIHRDLKPDNVMILDDAGGGMRAKVLDFGIAKVLHANEETAGQTKTGFVIGTPQWMSPEQILGETLDGRSDVYALALLAYFMLSGHRAFENASTDAEMMLRLTSQPRTLQEVLPSASWPAGLQELLNRTLARNVNERPSGALAFAKEFASIAARSVSTSTAKSNGHAADAATTSSGESTSTRDTRVPPAALGATSTATGAQAKTTPLGTDGLQQPAARGSKVPVLLGVAGIAAIAFFAFQWWSGSDGALTPTDTATVPVAGAPASDTLNRGAGAAPITAPPAIAALPAGASPPTTSNAATSERVPDPAPRTTSPTTTSSGAKILSRDSAKTAAERGAVPDAPSAPTATTKAATAASIELRHLMDLADVDFADKDLSEINNRIRRFEALLPELATSTDKGYAHLYIAMSHNALGDNAKACASLNRAEPLSVQSKGLRSNVDDWHQLLKCFP
ncbi:MAG: serine/threonine-protein kinase [Gemmatimonadaceae bacterium]